MKPDKPQDDDSGVFVAINHIQVRPDYRSRMEVLFQDRAHAVDRRIGFLGMELLRPVAEGDPYLVISRWRKKADFDAWSNDSSEFREGHRRAFADLEAAREKGEKPPMVSVFRMYEKLTA